MSPTWAAADIAEFDATEELRIAGLNADGALRKPVIIWMVTLDGALYVRSVNGSDAAWFRGTKAQGRGHISAGAVDRDVTFTSASDCDDDLDAAYHAKYRKYPEDADGITTAKARATTLRVDPA